MVGYTEADVPVGVTGCDQQIVVARRRAGHDGENGAAPVHHKRLALRRKGPADLGPGVGGARILGQRVTGGKGEQVANLLALDVGDADELAPGDPDSSPPPRRHESPGSGLCHAWNSIRAAVLIRWLFIHHYWIWWSNVQIGVHPRDRPAGQPTPLVRRHRQQRGRCC